MKLPNFDFEEEIWGEGFDYVIGLDEVGRGSFAGPVVAAAVIFRKGSKFKRGLLSQINDSKLLKTNKRRLLSEGIKKRVLAYSIAKIEVTDINKKGIGKSTQKAARKAIKNLIAEYELDPKLLFLLVDGFPIRYIRSMGLKRQKAIIKGDQKSTTIAAASILAKVYRDKIMKKLNRKYPGYGLSRNKGYGTKFHQTALQKYGLSDIHRTSFNLSKFLQ